MPALKNAKRERFCQAYVFEVNGNGAEAARIAKFSAKTARAIACELLTFPDVQGRIKELRDEYWKQAQMGKEEVLARLARVARFDPRKLFDENGAVLPVSQWDDDTAGAVAGVEVDEDYDVPTDEQQEQQGHGGSLQRNRKDKGGVAVGRTSKVKTSDRIKALELLGKVHGVFEEDNKQQGAASAKLVELLAQAAQQGGGVGGLISKR